MEGYRDQINKFTPFWEQWETNVFEAQFLYDLNCVGVLLGMIRKTIYFLFILSDHNK